MARSLAPSPVTSVSSGSSPRAARSSCSAASFDSRPKIGSTTVPASVSPASSSVLARVSSKPIMAATRLVNSVKPPETRQVKAPLARMVATSVRAPGVSVMRFSNTSSITDSGTPLSSATRSRSAGSKAISPRMARSVMAAT